MLEYQKKEQITRTENNFFNYENNKQILTNRSFSKEDDGIAVREKITNNETLLLHL